MKEYIRKNKGKCLIYLIIIYSIMAMWAVTLGSASIGVYDVFSTILKSIPFIGDKIDGGVIDTHHLIIFKLRMPRIIMATLVGMGLAVVGGGYQAVFKNPMADPFILGISSGAALGATLAIFFDINSELFSFGATTIFAFLGALLTTILVYALGRVGRRVSTTNILLSGIAISLLMNAFQSTLMIMAEDKLEKVIFWTMGGLSTSSWKTIGIVAPIIIIGVIIICLYSRDLDIILTGEENARSLGIDTNKVVKIIVIVSSFIIAAATAFNGIIGFVGLIVPHIIRLIVGPEHKYFLLYSAVGGAIFLVFADTVARTIASPAELPIGAVTALIGSPYFIFLLNRYKRG
ncbi:MAG: FecCD family ABC transporter permease [Clostridium sp.]